MRTPVRVVFADHAAERAARYGIAFADVADAILEQHAVRRRNTGGVRVEANAARTPRARPLHRSHVGLEYWQASTRLPSDLLEALPAPPRNEAVIERQPA